MILDVKMHADEADIDKALVSRLVAEQFPEWASLTVEPVESSGTDNAMFRLGADLAVRMPRMTEAAETIVAEQKCVPLLAPHLPVAVPTPVASGKPAVGYPYPWAVCRWLPGTNPSVDDLATPEQLAADLAAFILALRRIDPTDAPPSNRGGPLATPDEPTRASIAASDGLIDTNAATALWQDALDIPAWSGRPAWTHADLSPGNLLVRDGRLTAVIDWGLVGAGDPGVDLIVAWNLLPASALPAFREALRVDNDTWRRGRGWALSISLIQLPYYQHTNPALAANSRHVIAEILADAA